jgi:hypothetical protein
MMTGWSALVWLFVVGFVGVGLDGSYDLGRVGS